MERKIQETLLGLPNQTVCEDLPWKRGQPWKALMSSWMDSSNSWRMLNPFNPKMGILILLTINHGFLMLHMYFWEFSVQSICWHFIFLYCPYLYVEQCVEIVSRNKVFVTSESERVNVIFAVLEKSWKSPQKLFLKKGTNPDNNNNNSLYCQKIKVH